MKFISRLMIDYDIVDDALDVNSKTKKKLYKEARGMTKEYHNDVSEKEVKTITDVLKDTIKEFQKFWGYKVGKSDVEKMLKESFKGKHFSERVWDNEQAVAARLEKNLRDFINGKTTISKIKKDIEETFNTSRYNAKRLVDTEVSRLHDKVFKNFCKNSGVTWIKWNAILDERVCDSCASIHGKSFKLKEAPDLPQHPNCRCFFEIDLEKETELDLKRGASNE